MASVWPPTAGDRSGVLHAYVDVLSWGLVLGDDRPASADDVMTALARDPQLVVRTPCRRFDLVEVPAHLGSMALVVIERQLQAPCLQIDRALTFLVQHDTAPYLADEKAVRVKSGGGALLTLPPTAGARWDTPPWLPGEARAADLPDARQLLPALREVSRFRAPD